jgi:DNA repair exonuclease SbcCD ATPase subunit
MRVAACVFLSQLPPLCCLPGLQRREAQNDELAQLRARLAGEFDVGASNGSREAHQRSEALAAQLAEAQRRCSEYAREAEALRAEAARLAGARDGADAALVAAQAELEEVKGLLVHGAGAVGGADVALAARLAQLEGQNRQLAQQLEALQAGAGRHVQSAADVCSGLAEAQQVGEQGCGLPVLVLVLATSGQGL